VNKELEKKKVIVIIVTFNAMYWIDKCLRSLINSIIPLSSIVIDNNSQDATVEHIKKNYPDVKVIQNNHNLGFGKANNIGIKFAIESNYDYVFLLNQDAWIFPDTILKLIRVHSANKKLGVISPVQLTGIGNELDKNFSTYIPLKTLKEIETAIEFQKIPFIETDFTNAAAWLVHRDCLLEIGGFDPLFEHYGEDRDYCYRIKYHDFKIGVVLGAMVCHDRKYCKNNPYRKKRKFLFTVGLAHMKNVNESLIHNYFTWVIQRSKKILKSLLLFDFESIRLELIIFNQLVSMRYDIKKHRTISRLDRSSFLY